MKAGIVLAGLTAVVGFSALADNFFGHRSRPTHKSLPGYAPLTPPLQEWRTSFSSPRIITPPGVKKGLRHVTAYNVGDPGQTSGDPCTAASGENICAAVKKGEKRCAANFVKLGSVIHIQGYGPCKVTDRMHSRYDNRVDIALRPDEKRKARQFGVQQLTVTEVASPTRAVRSSAPSSPPRMARKQKNSPGKAIAQPGTKKPRKFATKKTVTTQANKKG